MSVQPDPFEPKGRRSYDRDIEPAIELFVEEKVRDTRHMLRNEFTTGLLSLTNQLSEMKAGLAEAALQNTRDHEKVTGSIRELRGEIAQVTPVLGQVADLRAAAGADDAVADALREFKQGMDRKLYAMGGLIVAAASVLVAILK